RAQHGRAADVDVLDDVLELRVPVGGDLLERVQVQHQQVDRLDAVPGHHRVVHAAPPEQGAVHLRVQGLDPAVHDLGEAGDLGDILHGQTGLAQGAGGAAGGQQLDVVGGEGAGEFDQAGLVRNGQQGPAD